MDVTDSILTSVKKLLGIDESYDHFLAAAKAESLKAMAIWEELAEKAMRRYYARFNDEVDEDDEY